MPLTTGRRLGPYEILGPIGAGGMGEVYRARDARLGRDVAVKVLPPQFSTDRARRARFEREARAVAALADPNVVAIFDFDIASDPPYAVIELLDGRTLREALAGGRLPLTKAVSYGRQVALGLASAHDKGIVHRDLKPENVFITADERAKVLDFGLAKAAPEPQPREAPLSQQATAAQVTHAGAVFGTPGYISPEQARGEAVDARSDVFALGAILYEMVAGRQAFPGPSLAESLASVLERDVTPFAATGASAPPALERIVMRCLAKRREERFQSARDLAFALETLPEGAPRAGAGAVSANRWRAWAALLAAGLLGLGSGALVGLTRRAPVAPKHATLRFSLPLPEGTTLEDYASASLAVSPAGDKVAFVATRGGTPRLYVRALAGAGAHELAGTEGASNPFFSPDGEWLGFESGARLRKIPVVGGSAQTLAPAPFFCGGAWGPRDEIVFVPTGTSGLWRVSGEGGAAERLTSLDAPGESGHFWPAIAPSGRDVLFTVWTGGSADEAKLALLSRETGRHRVLLDNASFGRFVGDDAIVFARGGRLFRVGYDPGRRQLTGTAALVQEGVLSETANLFSLFAATPSVLLYAAGSPRPPQRTLVWVDRSGHESPAARVVRGFASARSSPTDERIATSVLGDVVSLWTWAPRTQALSRVSFSGDDHSVAWSPDGRRLAFESGRSGTHAIFVGPADGMGPDERVAGGDHDQYLCDWSPDGRLLALTIFDPETGADLYLVELAAARTPRPFAATRFFERTAAFSPDGRFLAYVTDETGRDEVYLRPIVGEGKRQVSVDGGTEPAWSASGDEIFYRGSDRMMAARVGRGLEVGAPVALFPDRYFLNKFPSRSYDVARDGRFLMIRSADPSPVKELQVVVGW